jgi:glycosyltransferase involved in cell wall biosynthesis
MRRALIVYENIFPDDAVGYEAIEQVHCLQSAGWDVSVYAESSHESLRNLVRKNPQPLLADKSAVLIYHQAVFWEKGLDILTSALCKRVVKYHNITPAYFFMPYSMVGYKKCWLARHQNRQMVRAGLDMVICDSQYNAREFEIYGMATNSLSVCPPFNRIDKLAEAEPCMPIVEGLRDGKLNVFFVGRVAPNKGHASIIYTAHAYKIMFDTDVRFIIAGGLDPSLKGYYQDIQRLATQLQVSDLIEFIGQVSDSQLRAYLMGSHVFLLLSEHEGFCLPAIEAQAFELPVLARENGSSREVMGANQLVYDKDVGFEILACAVRTLFEEFKMRLYLAWQGRQNAAIYATNALRRQFVNCLEEIA